MAGLLLLLCLMAFSSASAQSDRRFVRQGNKQFRAGNYADSEVSYRKALERNARNAEAAYNLGNAMVGQRKDSAAASQFATAARLAVNPLRRAQAYHNMGVIYQKNQKFGEAIEAYKEALRNNPADDQTRYNLELCKKQQKQQQQNQQNQQNQQQNQDKKDQQKQDKQDQQKQDKKDQQQKQNEEQKQQMSRENAEQLLNAAMEEEKNTQERMKKAQQQPQRRKLEKTAK